MQPDDIAAIFDQQAAGYDRQAQRREPIENALRFLLEAVFAGLPSNAHVLCVGSGTGSEAIALAQRFPHWRFTLVEPSAGMVEVCRQKLIDAGLVERCHVQLGYLESLSPAQQFDGATCFLVSQFITDRLARQKFFRQIAQRLKPSGILASSDLVFDTGALGYDASLALWHRITTQTEPTPEHLDRLKKTYATDVAVMSMVELAQIVQAGGFDEPLPFFQAGLVQAWCATKAR
ncbi:SAM-dependent methyltransferase [Saccharospirillum sp. MSK14-1]|uniref:class I SAM-dependent methyltransferase n=1 Tax=Saccharospirillum sp. MSK14-1 TaxID=1897632 RepID=UPI000D3DC767|nr:class I SAM-dependent methyltransferase [Saccharospirillum sp. MSK14-1]PTY37698.1 SAM-dependent methyltransferase [Saccharospirillum sp. MSK14-1]